MASGPPATVHIAGADLMCRTPSDRRTDRSARTDQSSAPDQNSSGENSCPRRRRPTIVVAVVLVLATVLLALFVKPFVPIWGGPEVYFPVWVYTPSGSICGVISLLERDVAHRPRAPEEQAGRPITSGCPSPYSAWSFRSGSGLVPFGECAGARADPSLRSGNRGARHPAATPIILAAIWPESRMSVNSVLEQPTGIPHRARPTRYTNGDRAGGCLDEEAKRVPRRCGARLE